MQLRLRLLSWCTSASRRPGLFCVTKVLGTQVGTMESEVKNVLECGIGELDSLGHNTKPLAKDQIKFRGFRLDLDKNMLLRIIPCAFVTSLPLLAWLEAPPALPAWRALDAASQGPHRPSR